jgi:hypothetical protein
MKTSLAGTCLASVFAFALGIYTSNVIAGSPQPSKQEALAATGGTTHASAWGQPSKAEALAASGGGLTQPAKAEALAAASGDVPSPAAAAASACSLCETCGGDWPVFSGAIPTRTGARPYERGPSCSGDPVSSVDSIPYLCCTAVP